jgi:hypothetical protein
MVEALMRGCAIVVCLSKSPPFSCAVCEAPTRSHGMTIPFEIAQTACPHRDFPRDGTILAAICQTCWAERDGSESDEPVACSEQYGFRQIVQGDAAFIEESPDIAPDRLVCLDRDVTTPVSWKR